MKQKGLLIAGCLAVTAPTVSIADILPENLAGLILGEIHSSSFLNQPFKGVIPLLFTSKESSKNLRVGLAPESVFNRIGAEKHPILENLSFQIIQQDNKPVILISSNRPVQLPFLNFILEIQGPKGVVYQDYTVLLDPASKQAEEFEAKYFDNPEIEYQATAIENNEVNRLVETTKINQLETNATLQLANLASKTQSKSNNTLKYRVKAGDSLSKIAQIHATQIVSLQTMTLLIYQKNPQAFIRNDKNKIKKGALINLPTTAEIKGYEIARKNHKVSKTPINKVTSLVPSKTTYTVVKGDSLSKITKKFITKDMSYSKLMSAIYSTNSDAFLNKNLIKTGAEISIPGKFEVEFKPEQALASKDILSTKKVTDIDVNQYRVKNGDTLYSITKKMGYKGTDFGKMQKAIFVHNPSAFVGGKINRLEIGAVISLPLIEKLAQATDNKLNATNNVNQAKTKTIVKSTSSINPASSDLIKRIRELRKELKQAKDNLSEMQNNLNEKEILLQQKNIKVDSLNNILVKLRGNAEAGVLTAKALKTAIEPETKTLEKIKYKPISSVEMAKLRHDLQQKQKNTATLLKKAEEIKFLNQAEFTGDISSKYSALPLIENMSKANMAYISAALFLGLLLIRYRRELYALTYSAINLDQPKYYPAPKVGTYELKEKNINYHDPKMDEDSSNYEFLITQSDAELESEDNHDKTQIQINSLLVEAKEDIFADDNETAEVKECENLVTELFDELNINEDEKNETEWKEIEKVCDKHIERVNSTVNTQESNEKDALNDGGIDLNEMMSDLVESLGKVEKSVNENNIANRNFPELFDLNKPKSTENQKIT